MQYLLPQNSKTPVASTARLSPSSSSSTITTTEVLHPPTQSDLDALRLKLVQLIDAITHLTSQLHFLQLQTPTPSTQQPGLPNWEELLNRFNLLLSHVVGLGGLLSSPSPSTNISTSIGGNRNATASGSGSGTTEKGKEVGSVNKKKEKWESAIVAPAVVVEESMDWIVGMLLRTKQSPAVEAHLENLVKTFKSQLKDQDLSNYLSQYDALTDFATDKIGQLKQGLPALNEEGEEIQGEVDYWDWKGRVEIDSDEEDGEGDQHDEEVPKPEVTDKKEQDDGSDSDIEMMDGYKTEQVKKTAPSKKRPWTLQELTAYQRTGKRPNIA